MKRKEFIKVIPKMNALKHRSFFVNKNYKGYDLGYLAVRYLSEYLGTEYLNV